MPESSTIGNEDVMPLLLEACPSFREAWSSYLANSTYTPGLLYVDLGELARHLVELMQSGITVEFSAVFGVVEQLHVHGDAYVNEAAVIGLLEGIQNIAGNRGVDPSRFAAFLGPRAEKSWAMLNRFWNGDRNCL